jgi:hypothetical protein
MSNADNYSSDSITKVYIASHDEGGAHKVIAQYNPKELQVDRSVPWSEEPEANKENSNDASKNKGIHLQFTGAKGRSLTLELLFDGVDNVKKNVGNLEKLASVRKPSEKKKEDLRRPHHCEVVWGATLESFLCVIESLSTKYTMFTHDGQPLRATCTVKLKEADSLSAKKEEGGKGGGGGGKGGGAKGGK